jgi:hypothetical protein
LQGSTLHLCQVPGTPEHQKMLPMAGAAINRKDISRPADAWRNLFLLVLPPLADRSRGVKKYTLSAATAELQARAIWNLSYINNTCAVVNSGQAIDCTSSCCLIASFLVKTNEAWLCYTAHVEQWVCRPHGCQP